MWEATIAVARVLDISIEDARNAVGDYLELIGIKSMPVPPQAVATALAAFERYGKGRHPARLNFGDCFAYACARHYNLPLMFKGADFPLTDIEAA